MIFQPDLAERVVRGEKTVTRRLVSDNPRSPWWKERCGLVVGRDYAICPGRGKHAIGHARVVDTRLERLGLLDPREIRREGFETQEAFEAAWVSLNGAYDPAALVWRVQLEAVPVGVAG